MRMIYSILFISLALGACSDDNLPKYVQLGGLRVLALRADKSGATGQAEFSPGDTVTITPYVSDYGGGGRTVTYQAYGCVDPGVSYGADPSCDGSSTSTLLANGTLTLSAADSYTAAATTLSATIPSTILASRTAIDQYNGVSYLVTYQLTATGGASVKSFRKLTVSLASKTKNQNPSLTAILASGATLAAMPAADVSVSAGYSAGSVEAYSAYKSDGTLQSKTEQLLTTYFITDGSLKYFRTVNSETTTYTPSYPAPTDHQAVMVAVTRDDRGGVDVKIVKLN